MTRRFRDFGTRGISGRSMRLGTDTRQSGQDGEFANSDRIAFAREMLGEMAAEAAREGYTGTIGIEIPVKDGRLGKVKRLQILYQEE